MPRSRNNVAAKNKKKKVFKLAKGYFGRRKNVWTVTKNAVEKALQYSYVHRKTKKREIRSLWIQRINAAVREGGISYSDFMDKLKKSKWNTELPYLNFLGRARLCINLRLDWSLDFFCSLSNK